MTLRGEFMSQRNNCVGYVVAFKTNFDDNFKFIIYPMCTSKFIASFMFVCVWEFVIRT